MPLPTPVQLQSRFTTLLCDCLKPGPDMGTKPLTLAEFLLFRKRVAGWLTEVANEQIKEIHR